MKQLLKWLTYIFEFKLENISQLPTVSTIKRPNNSFLKYQFTLVITRRCNIYTINLINMIISVITHNM